MCDCGARYRTHDANQIAMDNSLARYRYSRDAQGDFSITITRTGGDLTDGEIRRAVCWLRVNTVAFFAAVEKGTLEDRLHLQCAARLVTGSAADLATAIKLATFLPRSKGDGARVHVKGARARKCTPSRVSSAIAASSAARSGTSSGAAASARRRYLLTSM